MAYNNKVVYNGQTLIDLSEDTVTDASHILTGHSGHLANGERVDGTLISLDTSNATASSDKIVKGYVAYSNGMKLTGTYTGTDITYEQGTLSSSAGAEGSVTTRVRSSFIPIDAFESVSWDTDTTYLAYFAYDSNKAYLGWSSWTKASPITLSDISTKYQDTKYIRFVIMDANNTSSTLTEKDIITRSVVVNTVKVESAFKYGGTNAVLIDSYQQIFSLADTDFVVGETSPTSSTTIKTTVSNRFVGSTYAYNNSDIVIVQNLYVQPVHSEEAELKAYQQKSILQYIYYCTKRYPTTLTNTTKARTMSASSAASTGIRFYNSSGVDTTALTTSYGFSGSIITPTVSSSTADSCYVRVGSPSLSVRSNTTYQSATNMKLVTECTWKWTVKVYKVDQGSTPFRSTSDDVWNELRL